MKEKKEISLIVCDIDNTVADYFNSWGVTFAKAAKMLAKSRKIDEDKIYESMLKTVAANARFNPNISYAIQECEILKPKNEKQALKFAKDDAKIIYQINKDRKKRDKAFKHVITTLKKAKSHGAKIVFYTDSPLNTAVGRLSNMDMPLSVIDGLYAKKNDDRYSSPPKEVLGKHNKFKSVLKKKLKGLMSYTDGNKPSPDMMKKIMREQGIKDPKKVVMVGDNVKSDGGGAIMAGMNFAWFKAACHIGDKALNVFDKVNDRLDYKLGAQAQIEQINDNNRPTEIMENGFHDLDKFYKFVPPRNNSKIKSNEKKALRTAHKLSRGR
jgi:FMN phosphatase YigB (HAD superfamily)